MPDVTQIIDALGDLDLNTGNGLIGETQLLQPASRAIFIGLGGTGNDALRRIKRIVHQRYKNIDACFRFIGVDSDEGEPSYSENERKYYLALQEHERVPISHEKGSEFFASDYRNLLQPYITEWLSPEVSHEDCKSGAGGFRAVGRALLLNSADKFRQKFRDALSAILIEADTAPVNIFILAGVGGGTGSGTLLDIAYICRGVAKDKFTEGYRDRHYMHGFIFLPDINTTRPLPDYVKAYIPPNAYAALAEIDYWMNIESRGDTFKQQYSAGFSVDLKCPPFDLCWPVSAVNADGKTISDAANQSMTIVAETICAWIAYQTMDGAGMSVVKSFIDNRTQITNEALITRQPGKASPVSYRYTACGSAIMKLPVAAINTYLACILFNKIRALYDKAFTSQIIKELSDYCSSEDIGLSIDVLEKKIKNALKKKRVVAPDPTTVERGILLGHSYERSFEDYLINLESNLSLTQDEIAAESLAILESDFLRIFTDPNKGPYYLDAFLENGNTGLIPILKSYADEALKLKNRLMNANGELELLKTQARAKAVKSNKNPIMILTHEGTAREYASALKTYYDNRERQSLCIACAEIYKTLQSALKKRVKAVYSATFEVLKALGNVFDKNLKTYDAAVNVQTVNTTTVYSWDVFTLPEIVKIVQSELETQGVSDQDITDMVQDFLSDLYDLINSGINRQLVAQQDLNDIKLHGLEINKFLANFVTRKFERLARKTLKEYMQEKASNQNKTLSQYLVDQFNEMEKHSSPLFHRPIYKDAILYYGSIPMGDTDISNAWMQYQNERQNRRAHPSINGDTLVFMSIACAIPLHSATQLNTAESEYRQRKGNSRSRPSLHLIRSTPESRAKGYVDKYWDWDNLPSIKPTDERPLDDMRTNEVAKLAEIRPVFERLTKKKIIRVFNATEGGNADSSSCKYTVVKLTDFNTIDRKLIDGELSLNASEAELSAYKGKLVELRACVTGELAPASLQQAFGTHFELADVIFQAAYHSDWPDPWHEALSLYVRSLNIQRDTAGTEAFYDAITQRLSQVEAVLKEKGSTANLAEDIVKAFVVGILYRDGNQWMINYYDNSERLALTGKDKFPLYAIYKSLLTYPGIVDVVADINVKYESALITGVFADSFDAFKAQIETELRKAKTIAIQEDQRFLLDKMSEFLTDITE